MLKRLSMRQLTIFLTALILLRSSSSADADSFLRIVGTVRISASEAGTVDDFDICWNAPRPFILFVGVFSRFHMTVLRPELQTNFLYVNPSHIHTFALGNQCTSIFGFRHTVDSEFEIERFIFESGELLDSILLSDQGRFIGPNNASPDIFFDEPTGHLFVSGFELDQTGGNPGLLEIDPQTAEVVWGIALDELPDSFVIHPESRDIFALIDRSGIPRIKRYRFQGALVDTYVLPQELGLLNKGLALGENPDHLFVSYNEQFEFLFVELAPEGDSSTEQWELYE